MASTYSIDWTSHKDNTEEYTKIVFNDREHFDTMDYKSTRIVFVIIGSLTMLMTFFYVLEDSSINARIAFALSMVLYFFGLVVAPAYANHYKEKFQRDVDWVKENCPALESINSLNEQYKKLFKMHLYHRGETFRWTFNSREDFATAQPDECFIRYIMNNLDYLKGLLQAADNNKFYINQYEDEVESIIASISTVLPSKKIPMNFQRYCDFSGAFVCYNKLNPATTVKAEVILEYHSPFGESIKTKKNGEGGYNYDVLKSLYIRLRGYDDLDEPLKLPNPTVTDELKYKIMSKGNYQCSKCHKKMQFGEPFFLHHFRPYSLGAPSEEWNLDLLCEECNNAASEPENSILVSL